MMNLSLPSIALLGTGNMGFLMARRLCQCGFAIRVWNRTPARAAPLTADGALVCTGLSQAVAAADIIVTMLEDGHAVESVLFDQGAAQAAMPNTLVVDMASIAPHQARTHALRLQALGLRHVDAPVSGGTLGAETGSLVIMAGGQAKDIEQSRPVLQHLGKLHHVGPSGSGQLAKIANQMIVGITLGAVAEALLLCEAGGADSALVRQALMGGFASSRVLEVHGQRMIEKDFTPRARLAIQHKDMRNALETSSQLGLNLPVTRFLEGLYAQARAWGMEGLDQAGFWEVLKKECSQGIKP